MDAYKESEVFLKFKAVLSIMFKERADMTPDDTFDFWFAPLLYLGGMGKQQILAIEVSS